MKGKKDFLRKMTSQTLDRYQLKEKSLNYLTSFRGIFFLTILCLSITIIAIPSIIAYPQAETWEEPEEGQTSLASLDEIPPHQLSVPVHRTTSDQVEEVPLETYVARVVASEMPAEFEMEALKAQSLAARTYVIHYMLQEGKHDSLSITDAVKHQVYKDDKQLREQWGEDYQWKMDKINQAVQATEGEVLTYDKELITPVYFSTSNGYTENSEEYWQTEIPYLRSVSSPWDQASPKYKDQRTFSLAELNTALGLDLAAGRSYPLDMTKTSGQRVKQITINGHSFTGRQVRESLALPSSDFTIEQKGDYFIFTTRGYGHGVGMSQYGANGMALEGKTYEDIINHYYQDVERLQLTDIEAGKLSALLD